MLLHTSGINDFDKLHIPFRAVAANIETGQAVVIGAGDLSEAIRASMSIPGIFAPMEIKGKMLVDGGIANNLPVDVVRSMGADILIVVDIGTPLRTREGLNSPTSITAQVMTILIQRNVQTQLQTLKPDDILIQPQLGNLGTTDFSKTAEAINIGQDTTKNLTDRLTRLSLSDENFQFYLARQRQQPVELPKIDYVKVEIKSQTIPPGARPPTVGKNADGINLDLSAKLKQMTGIPTIVENRSKVSPKVLEAQIETKAGERLDVETLNKDINRLYGLDTFERVDFHLEKKEGKTGLIFDPVEKSWGPTYLRFSLSQPTILRGTTAIPSEDGLRGRKLIPSAPNGEINCKLAIFPAYSVNSTSRWTLGRAILLPPGLTTGNGTPISSTPTAGMLSPSTGSRKCLEVWIWGGRLETGGNSVLASSGATALPVSTLAIPPYGQRKVLMMVA